MKECNLACFLSSLDPPFIHSRKTVPACVPVGVAMYEYSVCFLEHGAVCSFHLGTQFLHVCHVECVCVHFEAEAAIAESSLEKSKRNGQ